MRQKEDTEYQAKVIDDDGLTRGRVPCRILKAIGARPGDYLIFRLAESNKATMRVSRSRRKSGEGSNRKSGGRKRR